MSAKVSASDPGFNSPVGYGAFAVSLLLHGLIFADYGGQPSAISAQPIQSVTRLSFLAPPPEPVVVPEVIKQVVPEPKPEMQEIKPVRKEEHKVVKNKAKEMVVEPVQEVVQEQIIQPEPVAVVAQAVAVAAAVQPQVDEGLIKRETERYLTEVMAHIEKHKWYPKAARRRGVEGEVHVRFVLHHDGSTEGLTVESGPSMLVAAARKAVEKAMPMPSPPAGVHCPLECEFRMRFNLKAS